jgi:anti-sigma regulatory factor (Ser/Thr protein kinase)
LTIVETRFTIPLSDVDKPRVETMKSKPKSDEIRRFIIDRVEEHPGDIARLTAERFGITRQAVARHLATLVDDEILVAEGRTRERTYSLKVRTAFHDLRLADNNDEDKVWRTYVSPFFSQLSNNVSTLCYHGFTEMFNNAIDHSEGTSTIILLKLSAKTASMVIKDNGIGIFEKIKRRFGLEDYRHAIVELSKGKLTTDPARHTGQGIFFTSRMFDTFVLSGNGMVFGHTKAAEDWYFEHEPDESDGTQVVMTIAIDSTRTAKSIFDQYTDQESDDLDFSRTHVPLTLARYGRDQLISRSQAKRVLAHFDKFKVIDLDFAGIDMIGQAFADEIFRVFAAGNPNIRIQAMNANDDVQRMIVSAMKARTEQESASKS